MSGGITSFPITGLAMSRGGSIALADVGGGSLALTGVGGGSLALAGVGGGSTGLTGVGGGAIALTGVGGGTSGMPPGCDGLNVGSSTSMKMSSELLCRPRD
jgi:hypothetical protein